MNSFRGNPMEMHYFSKHCFILIEIHLHRIENWFHLNQFVHKDSHREIFFLNWNIAIHFSYILIWRCLSNMCYFVLKTSLKSPKSRINIDMNLNCFLKCLDIWEILEYLHCWTVYQKVVAFLQLDWNTDRILSEDDEDWILYLIRFE